MNYKLLVVDDEPANTTLLERIFSPHYEVVKARSGAEGLEMLQHHDVSLIISDQRMPGMTGIEFLQKAAELRPQCVRIILTGYTDAGCLIDAINSGVVYKYVTKPWVNADLLQTVKRGLSHFETLRAQNRLNTTNQRLHQKLDETTSVVVRMAMGLMNASDPDVERRSITVRDLALRIGKRLAMTPIELESLGKAAYLNEASSFKWKAPIWAPRGNSSAEDKTVCSVLDGLCNVPGFEDVVLSITYANERYDGRGPYGLSASQIPLESRIIAIAKAFHTGLDTDGTSIGTGPIDDLIAAIRADRGERYDPAIVEAFVGDGFNAPVSPIGFESMSGSLPFPR